VAASNAPVFITGESGTGKELTATALHELSGRTGHLQAINCEAIPLLLMESEIFGHVRGAFAGATATREGTTVMADGGTLFLDEVCAMDLGVQKKLLQFLQTGEFQKVGSSQVETADVRIICATNKNPVTEVQSGRLMEDLYYRLHVVPIELPPLRSRGADIQHIATHLLRYYSELENKFFHSFTADAIRIMLEYPWPGNIRELQNVIHNAVALHQGSRVSAAMLSRLAKSMAKASSTAAVSLAQPAYRHPPTLLGMIEPLWVVEQRTIQQAIHLCSGNVNHAAKLLHVAPSTIYRKMQNWRELPSTAVTE